MKTEKCPTCGAPAKMTWSGLDLVAETGDETLAQKHYEYQLNENDTLLAVNGSPNFKNVVEKLLDAVDDATDEYDRSFTKDYAAQLFEIVIRDFYRAACANGAVTKETVKDIASIAWTGAANAHRMYPENKHTFSKYWTAAESQFNEFCQPQNLQS